jgi:hypothetical protein
VGDPVHKTVFNGVGYSIKELLLQAPVVNGLFTSVSGGEHSSLSTEVLVNAPGDQGIAESVEVDEIFNVFGTIGQGGSAGLFVVDVKVYPIELNRIFSLRSPN